MRAKDHFDCSIRGIHITFNKRNRRCVCGVRWVNSLESYYRVSEVLD